MEPLADLLNSNALRVWAYLIAGAACLCAGRRRTDGNRVLAVFWFVLVALMLLLAFSRITDLGPAITEWGRDLARNSGWYDERRRAQERMVEAVAAAGLFAVLACFLWLVVSAARYAPLAAIAAVYLLTFVLIRAVSLHQIDQILYNRPLEGIRINSLMELTGIAVLLAGGLAAAFWPRLSRRAAAR